MSRWGMGAARAGIKVPPRVLVLLAIIAERTNAMSGIARPGYVTLVGDCAWSADTIGRTVDAAVRLGAIEVRRFQGRGRAAEFRFTGEVINAPNLDAFAALDRKRKTTQLSGLSSGEKTPQPERENAATAPEKGRRVAGPTVGSTGRSTEQQRRIPLPPVPGGIKVLTLSERVEAATMFTVHVIGTELVGRDRRDVRAWFRGGATMAVVQRRLELRLRAQPDFHPRMSGDERERLAAIEAFDAIKAGDGLSA